MKIWFLIFFLQPLNSTKLKRFKKGIPVINGYFCWYCF